MFMSLIYGFQVLYTALQHYSANTTSETDWTKIWYTAHTDSNVKFIMKVLVTIMSTDKHKYTVDKQCSGNKYIAVLCPLVHTQEELLITYTIQYSDLVNYWYLHWFLVTTKGRTYIDLVNYWWQQREWSCTIMTSPLLQNASCHCWYLLATSLMYSSSWSKYLS